MLFSHPLTVCYELFPSSELIINKVIFVFLLSTKFVDSALICSFSLSAALIFTSQSKKTLVYASF